MIMNNKIPIKKDLRLNEIKNSISKRLGYENFNDFLKGNCINNSAFVAHTLEQLMDQIIFEYHDKASTNEGKTELKSAKVFAADCFDASMVLKNHYKEQFNVIPVGRNNQLPSTKKLYGFVSEDFVIEFTKTLLGEK